MPDAPLIIRHGANLPHWRKDGSIYAVTFRLADSLPAEVLDAWVRERQSIVARAEANGRPLSTHELERLQALHTDRIEAWLDAGHGSCAMRNPTIAQLVADAIRHFDGTRYTLHAWCVMPNHAHAIVEPQPGHELSKILQSWKGFTARMANAHLGQAGTFWQKESYDHIIRGPEDYASQVRYVLENPAKAGLRDWPWVWAKQA